MGRKHRRNWRGIQSSRRHQTPNLVTPKRAFFPVYFDSLHAMADLTEDIDPHGDTLIIVPSPPKYAQVKDKSNDEDDQDAADDNPQGLSGDALAGSSALERGPSAIIGFAYSGPS
ncbi:hypothetical protein ACJZ2D_016046 [Fusarium nematophilum]